MRWYPPEIIQIFINNISEVKLPRGPAIRLQGERNGEKRMHKYSAKMKWTMEVEMNCSNIICVYLEVELYKHCQRDE